MGAIGWGMAGSGGLPVGLLLLAWGGAARPAARSARDQLVGTWLLAAVRSVRPDGRAIDGMGADPSGQLVYGADGRMAVLIARSDRPRFAAGDRWRGSPEENAAAVRGTVAYVGRYTVDEAEGSVTHHVETSLFPNWNGTDHKRLFTVVGDALTLQTPPILLGGVSVSSHLIWRRAT